MNLKELIKNRNSSPMKKEFDRVIKQSQNEIVEIELSHLYQNPYQPRLNINENELQELANSIEEKGLLQPIIVTKRQEGGYFIVAGHRRTEAHKLLDKKTIKAIKVTVSDNDLSSLAIIENLQRKDLDLIETALAVKTYRDKTQKTLEQIGKDIGKSKDYISRLLSMLELPQEVIVDLKTNKSTKDIKALSEINSFAKKVKKLALPTFDDKKVEDTQKSLYFNFLQQGREWLTSEIEKLLSLDSQKDNDEQKYTIKQNRNKVSFELKKTKALTDEKIAQIEEFIKTIV